jgi:hypothetical protein
VGGGGGWQAVGLGLIEPHKVQLQVLQYCNRFVFIAILLLRNCTVVLLNLLWFTQTIHRFK